MGATVTTANSEEKTWGGGNEPLRASYGKLMMWFFIVSDALTFSDSLPLMVFQDLNLSRHGLCRTRCLHTFLYAWCFCTHVLCGFDDFILIFSSVTMVLAVDAGHQMKEVKWLSYVLTIIGGLIFVGSQAWDGKISSKENTVIETGGMLQFVDDHGKRVALADFAATFPKKEPNLNATKANGSWKRPVYQLIR
jgi:cytochrome c oxidase subunit 3